MPTISDEAVCIRCRDWSETSQTVVLFARAHGALSALAKGAKREKGAFSGGIELLTRAHLTAIVKPSPARLATLTSWDVCELFPRTRASLGGFQAAVFMADLAGRMMEEHDPHPDAYDALLDALRSIGDAGAGDPALLSFQWRLLAACGHAPELSRDVRTGQAISESRVYAFSARLGGIVLSPQGQDWRMRSGTLHVLRAVRDTGEAQVGGDGIARANRLLATYAQEVIGRRVPSMAMLFA